MLPRDAPRRKGLLICRAFTVVGLILLLIGAAAIVVGYTWPTEELGTAVLRINVENVGN